MSLPNIKLVRPIHTITLPVSEQEINFKPYTAEEEKIILTANSDKDDIKPLITNFKELLEKLITEKINFDKLTFFDFIYLVIALRSKSKDEMFEGIVKECWNKECKHEFEFSINIFDNLILKNKENKSIECIIDENLKLILQPVKLNYIYEIDKLKNLSEEEYENEITKITLAYSIKSIFYKNVPYLEFTEIEIIEKIIPQLTSSQIKKCFKQLEKLIIMELGIDIECPKCKTKIKNDISNFLKY